MAPVGDKQSADGFSASDIVRIFNIPVTLVLSFCFYAAVAAAVGTLIKPTQPEMLFATGEARGIPAYVIDASTVSVLVTIPFAHFVSSSIRHESLVRGVHRAKYTALVIGAIVAFVLIPLGLVLGVFTVAAGLPSPWGLALVLSFMVLAVVAALAAEFRIQSGALQDGESE